MKLAAANRVEAVHRHELCFDMRHLFHVATRDLNAVLRISLAKYTFFLYFCNKMASVKIRNFSWTKQYNNLKEGNYIT